ncbi:DNA methyltransferase 1-associated protein 1 [Culicoides brevitarsis]|uniref:DNA methyltransferase 1-associated protein 1 n=1 Tax=Culicoides brevitarsis TaxID=469753 RepID=UPI00307B5C3C
MADVRDILDIERPPTPELTKESLLATKKKYIYEKAKTMKRPEGMHREVFALLYNDNKDAPPLLPTDTGLGYKQNKARLGMKKVRKWEWAPFTNPARKDGAVFHHWRRATDEQKEYPFAKFNKQLQIPTYTINEYNTHLRTNPSKWNKQQTDHLFDLAKRFDVRFVVMADRWDRDMHGTKSVEDLKERYYEVSGILQKVRGQATNPEKKIYVYDAEHERKRKEQLRKLFDRTQKEIEEEQQLLNELKKIEVRKKEREKKTQDLQKLISQADQGDLAANQANRKQDKKLNKKKVPAQQRPSKVELVVSSIESAGIKFADLRGTGVSLRSQRLKYPANVGQKKIKALEALLAEYKIEANPPPTDEICTAFNELRSDMVLLYELRTALQTCNFELESLKHQYEMLCPDKTLAIPPSLQMPSDGVHKVTSTTTTS